MKYWILYVPLTLLVLLWLSVRPFLKDDGFGSPGNPIKILLTPSVEASNATLGAEQLVAFLEAETGLSFRATVPTSFIAVVEAFSSGKADLAAMNTFSYILAHERYGVNAALRVVRRDGETSYRGQIIVRTDSGIDSLYELQGRKIAYVDAASTSGYILPRAILAKRNIRPAEEVFARRHDNVVMMVYQRQVDAGATYFSPPDRKTGEPQDARIRVIKQYPDIFTATKIISLTDAIPNDPFVFRKGFPEEIQRKIVTALIAFQKTNEGRKALREAYSVEGLEAAKDSDYDILRQIIRKTVSNVEQVLRAESTKKK